MYSAYWCPHCANQKVIFGSSFQYVNYVEYDPRGDNANPQLCSEKEIKSYPTWIVGDHKLQGGQTLEGLSSIIGLQPGIVVDFH
jgi:hypothetical protein